MFSEKINSVQTWLSIFMYVNIEMWVGAESQGASANIEAELGGREELNSEL